MSFWKNLLRGKEPPRADAAEWESPQPTAGKRWYMPRQQVVNFEYAGPEVDVWAAAACLYNLLTAATPRDFPAGKDVWQAVLDTEPVPIRRRDGSIPKGLAEVIDKALVDRPAILFKTAADLKKALLAAL